VTNEIALINKRFEFKKKRKRKEKEKKKKRKRNVKMTNNRHNNAITNVNHGGR